MTAKHTPGPWTVDYGTLKNARGESIASSGNNRKVWGEELDASLRLAAAAPELLEALEMALDTLVDYARDTAKRHGFDYCEEHSDEIMAAKKAIAKAKGETA